MRAVAKVGAAVAFAAVFSLQTSASARDNGGVAEFFAQQFGIGSDAPASASAPIWSEDNPFDRPLVVRPHHRKPRAPRVIATVKAPTGPVSIYEDRTLRRGDAVMTARGIRIFNGSDSVPYRESDFVEISEARVSKDLAKTLIAMDRVPRT